MTEVEHQHVLLPQYTHLSYPPKSMLDVLEQISEVALDTVRNLTEHFIENCILTADLKL